MLEELRVRNLGLIEEASLEPGPGLVVVSGETGAGKTLLLGALGLLSGSPARTDRIGPAGEEASVEGRFLVGNREIVVGRRLVSGGRNRAYLDGSIVPARLVEERMRGLVEIVGQQDRLAAAGGAEVRRMVDSRLGEPAVPQAYREAWERWSALLEDQRSLGGDLPSLERELEMVTFQAREISAAGFAPGDEEALRERVTRLRSAEELAITLSGALEALTGNGAATDALGSAVAGLRRAARLDPSLGGLVGSSEDLGALAAELALEVRSLLDGLGRHQGELADMEERLALLGALRRKYGNSLAEVLAFGERAEARRAELASLLERAARLEEELAGARRSLEQAGQELREARRRAAVRLQDSTGALLRELGFARPVIEVAVTAGEPRPEGADQMKLLFASDAALDPGPVSQVASGGELSRLVLSLRLAGGAGEAPVVAFDEVDAGLGGAAALALGRKLAALAERRQVLCVTHLPQVAAFADAHFVVERLGNRAVVRKVQGEERLEEISRMLAGLPQSERGRGHAEELLALKGSS
ncbi:MAG: DNA repair protein RecN [Acidimicrobiia bacterium]